jgi:hypothetical protein
MNATLMSVAGRTRFPDRVTIEQAGSYELDFSYIFKIKAS